jgi:hypothetical protein
MVAMGAGKLIKKVIMCIQAAFPLQQATSVSDQQSIQRVCVQQVKVPRFPSAESAALPLMEICRVLSHSQHLNLCQCFKA